MKTFLILTPALLGAPFLFAPFGRPPVAPTAGFDEERGSEVALTVIPVSVTETEILRVNTQRKVHLADGSWNDLYEIHRPGAGRVFLEIELEMAVDGMTVLSRDEVSLVQKSGDPALIHPFYWFLDQGLEPEDPMEREDLVIRDKATLRMVFEVPRNARGYLDLYVRDLCVITPVSARTRSAS